MAGGTFTAFVLARFDIDGTLDDSFGTGGLVTTNIGGPFSQEEALGVAIQPDGLIVLAGRATLDRPRGDDFDDLLVARLLSNGQPDPSFGLGGQVVTDVGGLNNEAQNVVVQPVDEMIVLSGSSRNPREAAGWASTTTPTSPATSPTVSPTRRSGTAAH
jgi:uncharacterized delta-60 repeat protein